jgi:hypothetical protein
MTQQELLAKLQEELDRLREDVLIQGQTQTDLELNQIDQGVLLTEIKGLLSPETEGGAADVRED